MTPDRLSLPGLTRPLRLYLLAAHVHLPHRLDIAPGRPQLTPDAGYRHGHRWIECTP